MCPERARPTSTLAGSGSPGASAFLIRPPIQAQRAGAELARRSRYGRLRDDRAVLIRYAALDSVLAVLRSNRGLSAFRQRRFTRARLRVAHRWPSDAELGRRGSAGPAIRSSAHRRAAAASG